MGIAALVVACAACANVTPAFAQAGSTGGTIGNTDTSASGVEKPVARHRPARPARRSPPSPTQGAAPDGRGAENV